MTGSTPDAAPEPSLRWRERLERAFTRIGDWTLFAAPPLALGALLSWSQAPFSAWQLLLPILAAQAVLFFRARTILASALIGWLFGVGYFLPGLLWIGEAFLVEANRFAWMKPFAVTLLPMGLSLFWAAAFAATRFVWDRAQPPERGARGLGAGALLLGGFWALSELLRGHVLTGFPWGLFAFSWIETPLAQSGAWIGAYGLNALTLGAGLALGAAVLGRRKSDLALLALFLAPLAALALAGAARLSAAPTLEAMRAEIDPDGARRPLIRLVQPNVPQTEKWVSEYVQRNLNRLLDLSGSQDGAGERSPELIVWPETSTPYLIGHEPEFRTYVMDRTPPGAALIAGSQRYEDGPDRRRWFNSLFVVGAGGKIAAVYDKHHLVPFGEYLPFQPLLESLGMRDLAGRLGGFSSGPGPRTLNIPGLPSFAPLICYEAIFPQDLPSIEHRPDMLLQITNDAWFGLSSGPYQHLVQARWRSIEQGLPLVRAANTGVSAAIDPFGRILASAPLGVMARVDVYAPAALAPTAYARFGEFASGLIITLMICIPFGAMRLHRNLSDNPE